MTDKERLEEIKNSYLEGLHRLFGAPWVSMSKENFDWLINRVEELEEALMFYADASRYEAEHGKFWNIILDGGKTAREALGVDKFETRQNRDDKTMGN